jgi:hypothetical protein
MKLIFTILFLLISLDAKAQTQSQTSVATSPRVQTELYSESTYYQNYDLVTESRLRSYYSTFQTSDWQGRLYLGISTQLQSPNPELKYFDDSVTPQMGYQFKAYRIFALDFQAGQREVLGDNASSQWDPRVTFSLGDYVDWAVSSVFTEYYGEASYVSRISSTPVSAFWVKQGYRYTPAQHVYIDPYGEFYIRESRSDDLGPSMTQWRLGVRSQWATQSWTVAALVYHNFNKSINSAPVEGMLVIGGGF